MPGGEKKRPKIIDDINQKLSKDGAAYEQKRKQYLKQFAEQKAKLEQVLTISDIGVLEVVDAVIKKLKSSGRSQDALKAIVQELSSMQEILNGFTVDPREDIERERKKAVDGNASKVDGYFAPSQDFCSGAVITNMRFYDNDVNAAKAKQAAESIISSDYIKSILLLSKAEEYLPYNERTHIISDANDAQNVFEKIYQEVFQREIGEELNDEHYVRVYCSLFSGEGDYNALNENFAEQNIKSAKEVCNKYKRLVSLIRGLQAVENYAGLEDKIFTDSWIADSIAGLSNENNFDQTRKAIIAALDSKLENIANQAGINHHSFRSHINSVKDILEQFSEERKSFPRNIDFNEFLRFLKLQQLREIFNLIVPKKCLKEIANVNLRTRFDDMLVYFSAKEQQRNIAKEQEQLQQAQDIVTTLNKILPRKSLFSQGFAEKYASDAQNADLYQLCMAQMQDYAASLYAKLPQESDRLFDRKFQQLVRQILVQKHLLEEEFALELDLAGDENFVTMLRDKYIGERKDLKKRRKDIYDDFRSFLNNSLSFDQRSLWIPDHVGYDLEKKKVKDQNRFVKGRFNAFQAGILSWSGTSDEAGEMLVDNLDKAFAVQDANLMLTAFRLCRKFPVEFQNVTENANLVLNVAVNDQLHLMAEGDLSYVMQHADLELSKMQSKRLKSLIRSEDAQAILKANAQQMLFYFGSTKHKMALLCDNKFVPNIATEQPIFANVKFEDVQDYLNEIADDKERVQQLRNIYEKLVDLQRSFLPNDQDLTSLIREIETEVEAKISANALHPNLSSKAHSKAQRLAKYIEINFIWPDFFHYDLSADSLRDIIKEKSSEELRDALQAGRTEMDIKDDFAQNKRDQLSYLYFAVLEEKMSNDKDILQNALLKVFGKKAEAALQGKFIDLLLENGYHIGSLTDLDLDIFDHIRGKTNIKAKNRAVRNADNDQDLQESFAKRANRQEKSTILGVTRGEEKGLGVAKHRQAVTNSMLQEAIGDFEKTGAVTNAIINFINNSPVFDVSAASSNDELFNTDGFRDFALILLNDSRVENRARASQIFLVGKKHAKYSFADLRNLVSVSQEACNGRVQVRRDEYLEIIADAQNFERVFDAKKTMTILRDLRNSIEVVKTGDAGAVPAKTLDRGDIHKLMSHFAGFPFDWSKADNSVPLVSLQNVQKRYQAELQEIDNKNINLFAALFQQFDNKQYQALLEKLEEFQDISEIDEVLQRQVARYFEYILAKGEVPELSPSYVGARRMLQEMREIGILLIHDLEAEDKLDIVTNCAVNRDLKTKKTKNLALIEDICTLLAEPEKDISQLNKKMAKALKIYKDDPNFLIDFTSEQIGKHKLTALDIERLKDYYLHGIELRSAGMLGLDVRYNKNELLEKFCRDLTSKVIVASQFRPRAINLPRDEDVTIDSLEQLLSQLEQDSAQTIEGNHIYLQRLADYEVEAADNELIRAYLPRIRAAMSKMRVDDTGLSQNDLLQIQYFYQNPQELDSFSAASFSLNASNPVQIALYVMKKFAGTPSEKVGNEIVRLAEYCPNAREEILLALTGDAELVAALKGEELQNAISQIATAWSLQHKERPWTNITIAGYNFNPCLLRFIGKGANEILNSSNAVKTMATTNVWRNIAFNASSQKNMEEALYLKDLPLIAVFGSHNINYEKYKADIKQLKKENNGKLNPKIEKALKRADFIKSLLVRDNNLMSKEEFTEFAAYAAKALTTNPAYMQKEEKLLLAVLFEKYHDEIFLNYEEFVKKVKSKHLGDFVEVIGANELDPGLKESFDLLKKGDGKEIPLLNAIAQQVSRQETQERNFVFRHLLPEDRNISYNQIQVAPVEESNADNRPAFEKFSLYAQQFDNYQAQFAKVNQREDKMIDGLKVKKRSSKHLGHGEYKQFKCLQYALENATSSLNEILDKQQRLLELSKTVKNEYHAEIWAQLNAKSASLTPEGLAALRSIVQEGNLPSANMSEKARGFLASEASLLQQVIHNRLKSVRFSDNDLAAISAEIKGVVAVNLQVKDFEKQIEANNKEIGKSKHHYAETNKDALKKRAVEIERRSNEIPNEQRNPRKGKEYQPVATQSFRDDVVNRESDELNRL